MLSVGVSGGQKRQNVQKPLGLDRVFSKINENVIKPLFFMVFTVFDENAIASRFG